MQALVYTQPNEIQLQERPYPEAAEGEVVLKIEAVGICGSDMHAFHGHDPRRKPGLVMGHELSGMVVESKSPLYAVGQRVTANPLITCGGCSYCLEGRDNLCSNRTMVGMTRPGAYAEFMSIPAASLVPIPENMDPLLAVFTEPAATALHSLNLSMRVMHRPLPEQRVLVIGGGAVGFLMALLLKSYGVRQLSLAETNPLRRDSAVREIGCSVFDPRAQDVEESSYHYVVDAVGAKPTRDMALKAVRPGGVIMHIGLQDWATEVDMRKLTLAEVTLLGTYTYSHADLHATVAALNEGAFGPLAWAETRSLEDGPQAFQDLHNGKTASAKIILVPHGNA